jgi:hypothetical protein
VSSRAGALLAALPLAVTSVVALLPATFIGFVLTCDEACDPSRGAWAEPGSWHWQAIGFTAIGGAALGVVFYVGVALRRTVLAAAALAGWCACAVGFLTLMKGAGFERHTVDGRYAVAILTLLGLVAIALASGRARSEARPLAE